MFTITDNGIERTETATLLRLRQVAKEEARAANESHSATTASNVRASTDLTRSQERAAGVGLLDPSAPTPQMRQRVAV